MNGTEALEEAITGVGVTPVTPFTNDLSAVDRAALKSNLQYLFDAGVTLVYPAGNTGEAMSLSPDEWTTVVEVALEAAGDTAMVLPGIGHEYPVAIELARRARTLGVDGVLLMPRIQPYVTSAGVARYWMEILDVVRAPAVVYKRGLPERDDLLELVQHDLVIACKYADKDISSFASTAALAADVIWTCGLAERYAPFFHQAGTAGFTSGMANFAPEMALGMQEALKAGNLERSLALRRLCLPFEEIRARHNDAFNVAAVKAAMDRRGLGGGRVRPPLVDLDPFTTTELEETLDSLTGART